MTAKHIAVVSIPETHLTNAAIISLSWAGGLRFYLCGCFSSAGKLRDVIWLSNARISNLPDDVVGRAVRIHITA